MSGKKLCGRKCDCTWITIYIEKFPPCNILFYEINILEIPCFWKIKGVSAFRKALSCVKKITAHPWRNNPLFSKASTERQSYIETKEADTWKEIIYAAWPKGLKQHSREMPTKSLKNSWWVCTSFLCLYIHMRQNWPLFPFNKFKLNVISLSAWPWNVLLSLFVFISLVLLSSAVPGGRNRALDELPYATVLSVCVVGAACICACVFVYTALLIYSLSLPLYCTWNDPWSRRTSSRLKHKELVVSRKQ